MIAVQIIFIAFALFALGKTMARVKKRELSYALGSLAVVVWTAVIVFTIMPEWLDKISEMIGIGRGVDTATYISILVLFYLVFRVFVRLEGLEDKLTDRVREEALENFKANE